MENRAFSLGDRDHPRAFRTQERGGVIADIPEALHDDTLALEPG